MLVCIRKHSLSQVQENVLHAYVILEYNLTRSASKDRLHSGYRSTCGAWLRLSAYLTALPDPVLNEPSGSEVFDFF